MLGLLLGRQGAVSDKPYGFSSNLILDPVSDESHHPLDPNVIQIKKPQVISGSSIGDSELEYRLR